MSILSPTKAYVPAAPVQFRGGVAQRSSATNRAGGATAVLREAILSGEFAPGERLFEQAVGERLGVSRTPVREALRTLIAEGLVDVDVKRGVVVAAVGETETADARLVRLELEVLAVDHAVQRMNWSAIEGYEQLVDTLESCVRRRDWSGAVASDRALHAYLVEQSKNAALIKAWLALAPRSASPPGPEVRRRWMDTVRVFRDIGAALSERAGGRAGERLRAHARACCAG